MCYRPAGFIRHILLTAVRANSVGIATHYGLYGPEIETWWRRDFPHPSGPALGPNQAAI